MAETAGVLEFATSPPSKSRRSVSALVWASDDHRLAEALEHLRHGLWPARYAYEIGEVHEVRMGVPCPLRRTDPAVIEYELRHGWMWVLVPLGADAKPVPSCI